MKRKNIIYLLLSVICCSHSFLTAQTVFIDNAPWEEVIKKAKDVGKPIFIDCYTSWCGPCKALAKNVFPQKEVGDFMNATFITAKYDMEKGDGKMLYDKYKKYIPGFPTMLVLDTDGNVQNKLVGYMTGDKLIASLQKGLSGKTLAWYETEYNKGKRDIPFMKEYVEAMQNAHEKDKCQDIIREFVDALPADSIFNADVFAMGKEYILDNPWAERYRLLLKGKNIHKIYRLPEQDRYQIDNTMGRSIKKSIDSLITITIHTNNSDSLLMAKNKKKQLTELAKSMKTMKDYHSIRAKLTTVELCADRDIIALEKLLDVCRTIGITPHYEPAIYGFMVEQTKNKKDLIRIVTTIQQMQDEDTLKHPQISWISLNLHEVLSKGYAKLGNKKRAVAELEEYNNIFQIQKKSFKALFGIE